MSAGELDTRVHFQSRQDGDDWDEPVPGGGDFATQFSAWAKLTPLRGGETVVAERLTGLQPYVVRVYRNARTRFVTAGWRIVLANDPKRVLSIKSPPHDPDGSRAFLEMLAEEGALS